MKEVTAVFQMLVFLLEMVTSLGYQQEDLIIHRYRQQIYLLEVQMNHGAEVEGALARDSVFGFDSLDNMARTKAAVAGINGMFFDDLGSPAGLLCENGKWIRISDIGTPSLIIEKQPSIQEVKVRSFWRTERQSGEIYALNIGAFHGLTNLFTREYGDSNRVFRPQVSYRIINDKITARYVTDEPIEIGAGFLMTFLLPEDTNMENIDWESLPQAIPRFAVGETLNIQFQAENKDGQRIFPQTVYQSGGWLIENGQMKAKSYEKFIGHTNSLQPRTAVGIDNEGDLLFLVADGRQKGVAEGLTGEWLAEVFRQYGVVDAAYLDGGASSQIWIEGSLLNGAAGSHSAAKDLAHAILFRRKEFQKPKR